MSSSQSRFARACLAVFQSYFSHRYVSFTSRFLVAAVVAGQVVKVNRACAVVFTVATAVAVAVARTACHKALNFFPRVRNFYKVRNMANYTQKKDRDRGSGRSSV